MLPSPYLSSSPSPVWFCAALCIGAGVQGHKRWMALVVTLISFLMPGSSASLTCPSACSSLSHVPYPFGGAFGCGSPGFRLDCSFSPPQWNVTSAGNTYSYDIINISSNPNHSNPQAGSYGYGGTVLVDATPSYPNFTCQVLEVRTDLTNDFISSNLYEFQYADLTYYEDSFFFFNCTSWGDPPKSGVLINSSSSCTNYLARCGFSSTSCMEYIPYQQLPLSAFNTVYNCSTRVRYVIPPGDENISTWKPYTQFAWGPVNDADSCYACQRTGGSCGYDTQDNSFLCYCGDKANRKDCKSGSSKAIEIGVSLSVFLLLFLFGMTAFAYRYKCGMLASQRFLNLGGMNEAAVEIPYWALSAATKSFSTKIGQGAFAKVYRGVLHNGHDVAVKVLDPSLSHTGDQVWNEVATIGNIHHKNIAKLVGYCFKRSRRILVYEYVSNGSLDKYLFLKGPEAGIPVLNWDQRFEIALGIARGLSYMHEECRRCIIHCDIKPQNILLDAVYCSKIADFGLARLLKQEESRVLTHARGTPGYVAPEFWALGSAPLSAKFDVYSYGIVLLELIRGRRIFSDFDPFCQEETDVNTFVSVSIDERIEHDANFEQVEMCTRVALWCIQRDPFLRPAMSLVVQFLQGTVVVPDNPPRPFGTALPSGRPSEALPKSSDGSHFFSSDM